MSDILGPGDFAWTFPVYILASDYSIDPTTGELNLDKGLRFHAPAIGLEQEQVVALYSDVDWAERFQRTTGDPLKYKLFPLETPARLARFLRAAEPFYQFVAVDLNRKTLGAQPFLIRDLIRQMDDLSCQESQDSP